MLDETKNEVEQEKNESAETAQYAEEVRGLERSMKGSALTVETAERLRELADMGIPRAQYIYAAYLYYTKRDEKNAEEYWKKAADNGEKDAKVNLADFYFTTQAPKNWNRAYEYYMAEDADPLTGPRRTAVKDILNNGKFNKRINVLSTIYLIAAFCAVLDLSTLSVVRIGIVGKVLFGLSNLAVWGSGVIHTKNYPYADSDRIFWLYLFIWFFFLVIWGFLA